MIKYVLKHFDNLKSTLFTLYTLYIISLVFSILQPYYNGKFLDEVINHVSLRNIILYSLVLIFLILSNIFVSYFIKNTGLKLQTELCYKIRTQINSHLQKIPYTSFLHYQAGYLNNRVNVDINDVVSFFLTASPDMLLNGIIVVATLIMISRINFLIFKLSLLFISIYSLLYVGLKKRYFHGNLEVKEKSNIYINCLLEQLSIMNVIRINATWTENRKFLSKKYDEYYCSVVRFGRFSQLYKSIDTILNSLFGVFVTIISAFEIWNKKMTIGQFTVLNSYFMYLLACAKFFLNYGKVYQETKVSYFRIKEIEEINEENWGNGKLNEIKNIKIKGLTFGFSDKILISNLTFELERNFLYGIKGRNGIGKTTLINLIIGLIQPMEKKQVFYNDYDILELEMTKIRKNLISVMPQEIKFYDVTVEEFFEIDTDFTWKNIINTIKKEKLEEIYLNRDGMNIIELKKQRISTLSVGQRQKIAFLKAIIKRFDVLILDEPSSALDVLSSKTIMNYLKRIIKDKIIILITHQKDLLDICDKIIELE